MKLQKGIPNVERNHLSRLITRLQDNFDSADSILESELSDRSQIGYVVGLCELQAQGKVL